MQGMRVVGCLKESLYLWTILVSFPWHRCPFNIYVSVLLYFNCICNNLFCCIVWFSTIGVSILSMLYLLPFLSFSKTWKKTLYFYFILSIFLFIPMSLLAFLRFSLLLVLLPISSSFPSFCSSISKFSHLTFHLLLLPCDLFPEFLHFCFSLFFGRTF